MLAACQKDSYLKTLKTRVLKCAKEEKQQEQQASSSKEDKSGGKKKKQEPTTTESKPNAAVQPTPEQTYLVVLEDTVLFPEGGGQPADKGKINGVEVLHVFRDSDGVIQHRVSSPIAEGTEVEVEVDWERRYDHMQQHTAQHLVTAITQDTFGYPTVGWTLGTNYCVIELEGTTSLTGEEAERLENTTNGKIRSQIFVKYRLMRDEDEGKVRTRGIKALGVPIRLVEIEGIDLNTCCGTHVSTTSEIQAVKFIGFEKTRGNLRLQFLAGNRVLKNMVGMLERERTFNKLLCCGPEDHVAIVSRLQKEAKDNLRAKNNLLKEIAELAANNLAMDNTNPVVVGLHRDDGDLGFLSAAATVLLEKSPQKLCLLTAGSGKEEGVFMVVGPVDLVKEWGPKVAKELNGKGGGKGQRFQGKAAGDLLAKRDEILMAMRREISGKAAGSVEKKENEKEKEKAV